MIRDQLAAAVREALDHLGVDPLPEAVQVERPARREHGDWSTNAALASAKRAGRNPRELAAELAEHLRQNPPPHVTDVEVAGPGFVNVRLADTWLHEVLREVVAAGPHHGRVDVGAGRSVLVEFVSANPTGPVHAGHGRGAAIGDTLARVFEHAGWAVTREFYINDRGVQMQGFADSLAARRDGRPVPDGGYHGEYVAEWAAEMPAGADPLEWGEERALADQREVLGAMNVRFDAWFSERAMVATGAIDATLADLREREVAYEHDGAVWLRSSEHGDDKDRVLVKSDGEPTYLLPDVAYHRDKYARGYDLLVNVWGADHHGYQARMKAALAALGLDAERLDVVFTQMVRLERDGEEVKLSKRSGDIVELREVLDEVGPDAARLIYLLQSPDSPQVFDLAVAVRQSMDNPVFYVQMAHARLCSIERVAAERGVERRPLAEVDLAPLVHERELAVLRRLSTLPEVVEAAAADRAPHRITTWVRELAGDVHGFHHDCPVVREDVPDELRQARLWLVAAARTGLAVGLHLLGVSAPESM